MKYILGCDPGLSGAMAVIDPIDGAIIKVWDTPTTLIKKGSGKRAIDLYRLSEILDSLSKDIKFMIIEDVHSMPNQGVASMFTFGKVFGIVIGMVASYNIPILFVSPQVWKGAMGLSKNKNASILKSKELFPEIRGIRTNDGQAEALLLAHFGKRFYK